MDLWVVGAAAAAGYIAKYWQNVSRDRDSLLRSGLSKCEKHENYKSTQRKKLTEDVNTVERLSDMYWLDSALEAEVSSSGYAEDPGSSENYDECNILSLLSLPPGVTRNENLTEYRSGNALDGDVGDNPSGSCTSDMNPFYEAKQKTSSLRTKYISSHFIKPLNSLESCLMAQLYKEHNRMEEYVLNVLPSPSTKMRPLLVTDGRRIINRLNSDSFSASFGTNDNRLHKDEIVFGVPPLPKISNVPVKIKSKTRDLCSQRFSSSRKVGTRRHFHSQNGSLDRTYLFCLGISVGIASALLVSRREVNKLQDLLKQTENLVQDLQEELEMKDSLTVKELAGENCESQDTCDNSLHYRTLNPLLSLDNTDNSTNNDGKDSQQEKAEENSDEMSKIEAELEAELERLGLNINTSSLGRRVSDLVELDPDFAADFTQGELLVDMINGRAVAKAESDRDKSGTPTTHSGNYAVSPRELSLRLHEIIETRLEERLKELEMALQNSERKVRLMESEHKNVWRKLSSSELRYSSDKGSPIAEEDINSIAQPLAMKTLSSSELRYSFDKGSPIAGEDVNSTPLVMNLSGEALDAYNEAYEELMKMNESEEDDSPSTIYENSHVRCTHPFNHIMLPDYQTDATNGSMTRLTNNNEKPSGELYVNQLEVAIEHSQGIQKLFCDGTNEDESSSSNDEMEKQLIKQIVEKTRKGSPVVLNAQRVLFSMDGNER